MCSSLVCTDPSCLSVDALGLTVVAICASHSHAYKMKSEGQAVPCCCRQPLVISNMARHLIAERSVDRGRPV